MRSKSRDYRGCAPQASRAIIEVFTEEQMVVTDLRSRFESDPDGFIVTNSDLSEEGQHLAEAKFGRWYDVWDCWGIEGIPPLEKSTASLRRQLKKCRSE